MSDIESYESLTDAEANIVMMLGEAWNEFLKLPKQHEMEQREFCSAIHACQNQVLARPGQRIISRKKV